MTATASCGQKKVFGSRFEPNSFSETPCGHLPMLTYNGTEISESMAIARLIAREVNLAGHSRIEEAQVDMIIGCMTDLMTGN